MVGWMLAAVGTMLMMPVLRGIASYHHDRDQRRVVDATTAYDPVNLQDFRPEMVEETVFGGSVESTQEGVGSDGSQDTEVAVCH